jgi:hypothetical protein
MENHRPFFITVAGILAGLAAVAGFVTTLQMLGLFPLWLGAVDFFSLNWLGAILWAVMTLSTIWALVRLWNLEAGGWLMAAVIATDGIILALVSVAGGSTWASMLPALIPYSLILLALILPDTREASSARPYA